MNISTLSIFSNGVLLVACCTCIDLISVEAPLKIYLSATLAIAGSAPAAVILNLHLSSDSEGFKKDAGFALAIGILICVVCSISIKPPCSMA